MEKNKKRTGVVVGIAGAAIVLMALMIFYQLSRTKIELTREKILDENFKTIVRMEVSGEDGFTLVQTEGIWQNLAYPELKYDTEKIDKVLNKWENLHSITLVKNAKQLEAYGIREDAPTITFWDSDGQVAKFVLGNALLNEQNMYIWAERQEKLYTVSQNDLSSFLKGHGEWIDSTFVLPEFERVTALRIVEGEEDILVVEDGEVSVPFSLPYLVNETMLTTYLEKLQGLKKVSLVATDTEQKEAFGLETPSLTIYINGADCTLTFGDTINGKTSFQLDNEPFIYQVKESQVKALKNIDPFKWIEKELTVPATDLIDTFSILNEKVTKTFRWIEAPKESNESLPENVANEEGTLPTEENVTVDETSLFVALEEGDEVQICTQETIDRLLEKFGLIKRHSMIINADFEQQQQREAELVLAYTFKDGTTKTYEFIPYDPKYYFLREDGMTQFSVDKTDVLQFLEALEKVKVSNVDTNMQQESAVSGH